MAGGIPGAPVSLDVAVARAGCLRGGRFVRLLFRSSFQRKLESSDCLAWLSRYRDLAAYAAGISDACRRPSHFFFAGPIPSRGTSSKSNQKEMA